METIAWFETWKFLQKPIHLAYFLKMGQGFNLCYDRKGIASPLPQPKIFRNLKNCVISYTQFANKLRMVIASSCSKASLGFMHCGATGITWIKFQASHIVRHHQISASQSAIRYKKHILRHKKGIDGPFAVKMPFARTGQESFLKKWGIDA